MTANHSVANSPEGRDGKSLSPLAWLFAHDRSVPLPSQPPKPPPVLPADNFLRAVRDYLGKTLGHDKEISQDYLADWVVADRSSVGRWEMRKGSNPSWKSIGRILVLLGIVDVTGKQLHLPAPSGQAGQMGIEERVLAGLRQLPDSEKLDILQDVTRRLERAASNQSPAALKKG